MKRTLLTILSLLISFYTQAMSELEFVERLQNTHPFFEQLDLSLQIKQVEKQGTVAGQDWVVGVDAKHKNEDTEHISSITSYNDLTTTTLDVSATKKLFDSGSDVTLKHTWKEKNKDINTTRNKFSLDYTYPLLLNKGGINDRLDTDLASIDIQTSLLDKQEQVENFVLEKLKKFVDLAYAQERQLINEQRLRLADQELKLVKNKFAASVVDRVDVLLQEDAYQSAKQQRLQAQQDLLLLRHEIAIILDIDVNKAVAEFDLYKPYKLSGNNLKQYLLLNARVLKITDFNKNTLQRQLKSFKNESQAQLDLSLGLVSEGESVNHSDSLNNQSPTWNIGLGLSYPIGGTKSKSNVEKTQIKLTQLRAKKQEQFLNIHTQATLFKEKTKLLLQMLASNKVQINIAKSRTAEERDRYTNGNGEASFVISAQNNEQNAQLGYAQTAQKYQKSVLEYKATVDQLVQ
jgi:outer membrane protein TolC